MTVDVEDYFQVSAFEGNVEKSEWERIPCRVEANMAKLVASEANLYVTNKGMELLDQFGCLTDFDMQQYWRDAKIFEFAPITNEMVRNILGESLGLPRSF